MIQKLTILNPSTVVGFFNSKTFHVYTKKIKNNFCFTKNSIRFVQKKNSKLSGKKIFSFFTKPVFFLKKKDNSFVSFFKNQAIPLRKKKKIIGSFVIGPTPYCTKLIKFRNRFSKLV